MFLLIGGNILLQGNLYFFICRAVIFRRNDFDFSNHFF